MAAIRRRTLLGGLAASGGLSNPGLVRAQPASAGEHLTAQTLAGAGEAFVSVYQHLDRTQGSTTTTVPIQAAAAFARMQAEAASPEIDLYQFSGGQERTAADRGLAAPLGQLSNLENVSPRFRDPGGRWVHALIDVEGILYRTDKVSSPPRSYKDLLNPAYQGHVAFPTIANGYGTDALVMMARAFGGGEHDIDPGFKAMAKIANSAIIFRSTAEVLGLFAQQDVWIMPYDAYASRVLAKSGLPVAFAPPEEGSPAVPFSYCIAAKSSHLDLARKAVDLSLAPDMQLALAEETRTFPTNSTVKLPDQLTAQLPKLEQITFLDSAAMNQNRSAWTERWNREIAR